jgi:hypothetical protein
MCDTKYFAAALDEWRNQNLPGRGFELNVGDISVGQLSCLLRRAQELKDADRAEQIELGRMNALGKMDV